MRNLWSKTLLPKCMIQLYFPAPWFMTTFGLLLTPDRHFFFSWSLQDQDLNEVQVLFYPVGCQKHLLGGSASSHPGVCWFLTIIAKPFPAQLLSGSVWSNSGTSQTSGVRETLPVNQRKILPFIWGHMNPSDQSITCVFGWLSNAFLLQHEGHSLCFPWDFSEHGSAQTISIRGVSHFRAVCVWAGWWLLILGLHWAGVNTFLLRAVNNMYQMALKKPEIMETCNNHHSFLNYCAVK